MWTDLEILDSEKNVYPGKLDKKNKVESVLLDDMQDPYQFFLNKTIVGFSCMLWIDAPVAQTVRCHFKSWITSEPNKI